MGVRRNPGKQNPVIVAAWIGAVAVVLAAAIALIGPWVKPKDPVPKPAPLQNPTPTPVVTEIKDKVISIDGEVVQRGPNDRNYSPTQYLARGHAVISYTGTGIIQNGRLIACITEGEEEFTKGTNHCIDIDEEDVPVRVGTQTYPFVVYMPGGDDWKSTVDHVTIMVCVVASGSTYFEQPAEQRFRMATPICGFHTLKL